MACYICLEEDVKTDDVGLCARCNRNACSRPPQRRDERFHGDVCAFPRCGLFFCERHLHTHPHESTGVSSLFPALAMAIALGAIAAASELEDERNPQDKLAADRTLLARFNRFLTVVSPGATALSEVTGDIPKKTFAFLEVTGNERVIELRPEFFTRGASTTVSRMALRTMWIAGSALDAGDRHDGVQLAIRPWIETLGPAPVLERVTLDNRESELLLQAVRRLPRVSRLTADLAELPAESSPQEVARFLVSTRDEGMRFTAMGIG
jgi:hypothetical protein